MTTRDEIIRVKFNARGEILLKVRGQRTGVWRTTTLTQRDAIQVLADLANVIALAQRGEG